jgi:CheY-like chemotaxis protein
MTTGEALQIVLVEDNEADAFLIREALRQSGIAFELSHLNNGDRALDYLFRASPPPSLLLLDLHLPGTDGPEILRAIRGEARLASMPVIIITGASADWLKGVDLSRSTSLVHKSMDVDDYLREIGEAVLALHPQGAFDARNAGAE